MRDDEGNITGKRDYYVQRDQLSNKYIYFAIDLQKGHDIRSVMSHPRRIQIDVSHYMKIMKLIMVLEFGVILFLLGMIFLPPEYLVILEPYFNIPTLAGYSIALFTIILMLYRESNYMRAWIGNFMVIYKFQEPLRFILDGKEISVNPEIHLLRLYESEKAIISEVFGYNVNDIADMIQSELVKKIKNLENELHQVREELAAEAAQKNKLLQQLSSAKKKFELFWEQGYRERARETEEIEAMSKTQWYHVMPYIFKIIAILVFGVIAYFTLQNVSIVIPEQAVWLTYILIGLVVFLLIVVFMSFLKAQVAWNLGSGGERR